jgi:flavin reductase (DIM6/NTAB) family NADH-FMN oxidoreductase RutF
MPGAEQGPVRSAQGCARARAAHNPDVHSGRSAMGRPVTPGAALPPGRFRDALGRFASGVTIITTRDADSDYGATVSAFSSVSMDPPLILCCFSKGGGTMRALLRSGRFAVNLLEQSQSAIAKRFASPVADRFDGVKLERDSAGLPLVAGALAQLTCTVTSKVHAGDHIVVFGTVESIEVGEGEPLVVFRGGFGSFLKEVQ